MFRLGYGDRRVTLVVREGFVTDEFIDLARQEPQRAQERQLDALKLDMAGRVMARPAHEVYDVAMASSSTG